MRIPLRTEGPMEHYDGCLIVEEHCTNKYLSRFRCENCGETLHDVKRELVKPPSVLIININRMKIKITSDYIDYF